MVLVMLVCALVWITTMNAAAADGMSSPQVQGSLSADSASRQYLKAHGFKVVSGDPDVLEKKHVKVVELAREFGFSVKALEPMRNAKTHDGRLVNIRGLWFVIQPEMPDAHSVDLGESVASQTVWCKITVSLKQLKPKGYLKAESKLSVRITAASVIERSPRTLEITMECSASGRTPVCFSRGQVGLSIRARPNGEWLEGAELVFDQKAPKVITVTPGMKPVILTVHLSGEIADFDKVSQLPRGAYDISVFVGGNTKGRETYDYQWTKRADSPERQIIVR